MSTNSRMFCSLSRSLCLSFSLSLSLSATVVDDQHELQSIGNLSLPGLAKLLLHRRLLQAQVTIDPAHPASSRGGSIYSCFNCTCCMSQGRDIDDLVRASSRRGRRKLVKSKAFVFFFIIPDGWNQCARWTRNTKKTRRALTLLKLSPAPQHLASRQAPPLPRRLRAEPKINGRLSDARLDKPRFALKAQVFADRSASATTLACTSLLANPFPPSPLT